MLLANTLTLILLILGKCLLIYFGIFKTCEAQFIIADDLRCPTNFSFIKTSTGEYCYQVLFVTEFDGYELCPYNEYEFDLEAYLFIGINSYLPVKRDDRGKPFVWTTAVNYGKFVYDDINITNPHAVGDCLQFNNQTRNIITTVCTMNSHVICLYLAAYKNCPFPYEVCYQYYTSNKILPRSCNESLAEPIEKYYGYFVSNLHTSEKCWIGLVYDDELGLVWEKANTTLNYYDFLKQRTKGKFVYTYNSNWYYLNNWNLINCVICEIKKSPTSLMPELVISWDNLTLSAKLNVTNADYFMNGEVYCNCVINTKAFSQRFVYTIGNITDNLCDENPQLYKYVRCIAYDLYLKSYIESNTIEFPNKYSKENGYDVYSIVIRAWQIKNPFDFKSCQKYANLLEELCVVNCTSRPMRVTLINETYFVMTFQIYQLSLDVQQEYQWVRNIKNKTTSAYDVYDVRKSNVCMMDVTNTPHVVLTWPETGIGSTIVPTECCDSPVTRTCLPDSEDGPVWSPIHGNCLPCTDDLKHVYDLLSNVDDKPLETIVHELKNISESFNNSVNYMKVHYSALILNQLSNFNYHDFTYSIINNVLNVIDNVMQGNKSSLNITQFEMNTTDIYLCSLDNLLNVYNKDIQIDLTSLILRKNSITSSIVGWYLTSKNIVNPIHLGTTLEEVLAQDPTIAAYIPDDTVREIKSSFPDGLFDMVFTFFANDHLFNEKCYFTVSQWIVGIDVPNFNRTLSNPIHVIRKGIQNLTEQSCTHWKYGMLENDLNIRGRWFVDYSNPVVANATYLICNYTHMTHFGMILSEYDLDDAVLNIITLMGVGLSVIGVIAVTVTLILYKKGTDKKNIVLIINYLVSIIFLPVFLYVANAIQDGIACELIGCMLHYSVISQTTWTVVLSYLQYRRYIIVFNSYKKTTIIKACCIGWTVSIIPVIIVSSISIRNYHKNKDDLCYLSEEYIKLAVVLPIVIILSVNMVIFIKILLALSKIKKTFYKDYYWSIFKLSNYLFFLFGLSWIFGVLVAFYDYDFINYIFSCLTSMQGFIICIHFISTTRMKIQDSRECFSSSSSKTYNS